MKSYARLAVAALASSLLSTQAVPVYQFGSGGISFGVAPYGGVPPGIPTYIPNNVNGINDVLTSPGGTFLTANPSIPNNVASTPYIGLPLWAGWIGGGNINGPFGSGYAAIDGPTIGYGISDPVPGGGSASYGIAHWQATFNDAAGSPGYGSFLSVAGVLPDIGSAAVVALRTHVSSALPASPFFGGGAGIDLPPLILALSRNGPLLYSTVFLGGSGAAMLVNGPTGNFRGLAINNFANPIPAGDTFTAESTLTFYADPASFDVYSNIDPDLITATGTTMPAWSMASTVPEPGTTALLISGGICLFAASRKRRK